MHRLIYCDISVHTYRRNNADITIHFSYTKLKLDKPIPFTATLRDHIQIACDNILDQLIVRRMTIVFYDAGIEIDIFEEHIDEYIDVIVCKSMLDTDEICELDDATDELHFSMDE